MVEQGLVLVEEIAEVIIKQVQEPWRGLLLFSSETGEWFCGERYSDGLIIWRVMRALSDLHVNFPGRSSTMAPPHLPVKISVFGRLYYGPVGFAVDQEGVIATLTPPTSRPSSARLTVDSTEKWR